MKNKLKITAVQFDIEAENPKKNCEFLENVLENHTSDLIVLPEMFNTGFTNKTAENHETTEGYTINWMKEISIKTHSAICGSLLIKENNKFYNRFILIKNGEINSSYNKRHLFTYSDEHLYYEKGKEKIIFELEGWKFLSLICYDLRFPVWIRNKEKYDAILNVANWPAQRITTWNVLLQARAIENMAYSIGVNRTGTDQNAIEYNGNSKVFNVYGQEVLPKIIRNHLLDFELDKEELEAAHSHYKFLEDIDEFELKF